MNKKSEKYVALNRINAADYGITMFVDTTTPAIIKLQLFWFDERITEFLSRSPTEVFPCSNGVLIGLANEFKYTPAEMEGENAYLSGFSSNTQYGCYDELLITVGSEEEKIGVCTEVTQAISELIRAASDLQPGDSPVIRWKL